MRQLARTYALLQLLALALLTGAAAGAPVPIVEPQAGGTPWSAGDVAKLQSDLDALLNHATTLRGAHAGVLAIDTASGAVLYERNPNDEFQPASTVKLLVGSAALEKLGPAYRFRTEASSAGDVVTVHGGGDPSLQTADLDDFAAAVARVLPPGTKLELSADERRYDDQPYAPGWTWDDFAYDYAAPVSALSVDENVVHIVVSPGANVGDAATLAAVPLAPSEASIARDVPYIVSQAATLAPGAASTLDVQPGARGEIVVTGGLAAGSAPEQVDAAVRNPVWYALSVAAHALQRRGIPATADEWPQVAPYSEGQPLAEPPAASIIWTHESQPLASMLGPRFWIPSDNLTGEVLLKELGYQSAGARGSRETGIAFEKTWLQSIGVDPATVTLADGCGMSQYDRITPHDLVAILQHDWNGPNRRLVLDSLPVGGARGTIEGIAGTAAAGRVFAKTGSIMHVRGLAGYLMTERHGAVTFAFNVDDWNGDYADLAPLRARVLSRIVSD